MPISHWPYLAAALLLFAPVKAVAALDTLSLQSGALTISFPNSSFTPYVLSGVSPTAGQGAIGTETPQQIAGAPLSAFVNGALHTVENGGLLCDPASRMPAGTDRFGNFAAVAFLCRCATTAVSVVYEWRAYDASSLEPGESRLVASVAFPSGANGTASGSMLAPLPAWQLDADASPALATAGFLCYGGDKAHIYSRHAADGGIMQNGVNPSCFGLGGGPATTLWPSESTGGTGIGAMVQGPASAFHLSVHAVHESGNTPSAPTPSPAPADEVPATLFFNAKRGDVTLCISEQCRKTQTDSGYTVLFEEGYAPASSVQPMYAAPLYFSWSATNEDNWVTTDAGQPGPSYTNFGNDDGNVWKDGGGNRQAVVEYTLDTQAENGKVHHMAAASNASKKWALAHGYVAGATLGYLDPLGPTSPPTPAPPPTPPTPHPKYWGFGLGSEVAALPSGFAQETLLTHSSLGISAAWDAWGVSLRRAHNTTKLADSDPFVAALSIFTDNGAATLGAGWQPTDAGASPPPYDELGDSVGFGNHNWSMVNTDVLASVATEARDLGVPGRGLQLDCWWYPVLKSQEKFWCASDWILPERYYPNGTGGVRAATQLPLMLYLPAACPASIWSTPGKWPATYSWADPTHAHGFLIPTAEDSARFWGDVFDYGSKLASRGVNPNTDTWKGVWVPPMVREGWRGTNLAAYETDFYTNLMRATPRFRANIGEGEAFLQGIDTACAARNMTAQLCAGDPNSFLTALTMPTITNARASIDYDWDGNPPQNAGPRSSQGSHNWAAADNAYVFWATRVAPSKDNFWSSYRDFSPLGYHADSGRNGMDAELHALGALLSTGPVGLGDYAGMINRTLVRRLARADGILLRPDRPLGPVDIMWASLTDLSNTGTSSRDSPSRAMPGLCTASQEAVGPVAACGARLWQTHATIAAENALTAPELATAPTRMLVSHSGVDSTRLATVTRSSLSPLLQHIVVSVDQNASFVLQRKDLYPAIPQDAIVLWRRASDGGAPCAAGTDAVVSGCIAVAAETTSDNAGELFDVTTADARCSQGGVFGRERSNGCMHSVEVWQIFSAPPNATSVFLGDLSTYVSLSGYRFRSAPGGDTNAMAVVGMPGEIVTLSWAVQTKRSSPTSSGWVVRNVNVTIGAAGRSTVPASPPAAITT